MILQGFLLFIGFILLVKGADFLVDGGSEIAAKFRVPPLVIGLTIIAFGTSMPELVVTVLSSISGDTQLAVGNIVGSNIANTLLILGASAAILPLTVKSSTIWKEIPLSLLALLVLFVLGADELISGVSPSQLSRGDGFVLLGFFAIFLYYTYSLATSERDTEDHMDLETDEPLLKSGLFLVGGLIGLIAGGKMVVDSASAIATNLGMSQNLIAVTILAIGTSLPELVANVVAVLKNKSDLAVGNVVGSNIFNVFWILGVGGSLGAIPLYQANIQDLLVGIAASLLLFFSFFVGKKRHIDKWQGYMYLLFYAGYMIYVAMRG